VSTAAAVEKTQGHKRPYRVDYAERPGPRAVRPGDSTISL
jgi:hypothetical protein